MSSLVRGYASRDSRPSARGSGEAREVAAGVDESTRIMKFGVSDGFDVELRRRVEAFFRATGRRQRDCWQIYVKTVILVAVGVASYLLLALGA